jgi:XTP/dITP diphosphohydrolase
MKLVFATSNLNKMAEIQQFVGSRMRLLSLTDIGCSEEIEETSATLEGNAFQKARFVAKKYGVSCFADDTGLEIEALDFRPGVFSARYAGEDRNAERNMDKVLLEMLDKKNRNARFRTVIALVMDGKEESFEGILEGKILFSRQGKMGFGYDPIFQPHGFSKSLAELTLDEKNQISHRVLAFSKLISFLEARK